MRLSKLTLGLAVYIVISAYFNRQLWDMFIARFGKTISLLLFCGLCLLVVIFILRKSLQSRPNPSRLILLSLLCVTALIFALKQPYPQEKMHILTYGLLGWLSLRDMSRSKNSILTASLTSLLLVAIIGLLDEGFQRILPWRYFEIRDVVTNIWSGTFGIAIFILQK